MVSAMLPVGWIDRALAAAALFGCMLVAGSALAQSPGSFSTLSTTGTATLNGDVLMCSGRPWIDVRCPNMAGGAVGDGSHDDTSAIQTTINTAVTNNWPVHVPPGTYKVTAKITVDYAGQASNGFRLISEGATIDGRSIAAGPVVQVECSGGIPGSPTGCFYFKEEGVLFVLANTPAYAVVIGKTDFSDAHNTIKLDHLNVNNASSNAAAGGCQFNYVLDSDLWAACVSAGGAAGLAFEQTQFSRISGSGTAAATGGRGVVLENGYNYANIFFALDLEVSPTCLGITFPHDGMNTFVSPYFACITAVNATASTHNLLINPTYAGNVVNRGPQSVGIQIIGAGNWARWQFPAVASYSAAPIDDKTVLSSFNAPGASLSVTLPAPGAGGAGWSMGFATDNGKGLTVTAPAGMILGGGKALSSVTLGPGNYEYLQLESDGSNFRIVSATRSTLAANGMQSRDWPGNWLYPASSGYAATLGDNGTILSSFSTSTGLTVTLPSTTGLPSGWSMGFVTENGKGLTIQVNATSGGNILYPLIGASAKTSLTMAGNNYEFVLLQYDGGGNFRVEQATPGTAQQLNMAGIGGISRFSFPSVSAYAATVADNGNAIVSSNSPLAYLAVTLPSTTALNAGWTIAIVQDNNKTNAVQVNATSGGHILYPGSGATQSSVALAAGNYEHAVLQYDGAGNFRVVAITPASAAGLAMPGTSAISRWSFPAVNDYAATVADNGSAISSFNAPGAGATVTLPAISTIAQGWTIGVATDAGKTMTVAVSGGAGEKILIPGTLGAKTSLALSTNTAGYELAILQFDGSNFRVLSATPLTANLNGLAMLIGTPASSTAACQTGAMETDGLYLYFCAAPNTWKRSAWSSF
jgi:hypothetical protein